MAATPKVIRRLKKREQRLEQHKPALTHHHAPVKPEMEEPVKRVVEPKFYGKFEFKWQGNLRTIDWFIIGNSVVLDPQDDFLKIPTAQRIRFFNNILGKYRYLSVHPQQIKSAAIGVTTSGDIFIGVNTQRQHEYHKDCAEVNLVNEMTQSLALSQPEALLEEIYLMMGFYKKGGKIPEASEHPFCTCGKCTDMVGRVSTENATFVTLPANDGEMEIPIDYEATSIIEVKDGHGWCTKFRNLLIDHKLTLNSNDKDIGREAFKEVTESRKWSRRFTPKLDGKTLPQLRAELKKVKAELSPALYSTIMEKINGGESRLGFLRKEFNVADLNSYMVDKLVEAYKARDPIGGGMHNVAKVRCVVVRLDNGVLHSFIEAEGPQENATPYAEVAGMMKASEKVKKITDVWVMEMSPEDISKGVVHTPSKEGLERLLKRKPKREINDYKGEPIINTINLHIIPFNNGKLNSEEVDSITKHYDMRHIFASRFEGVKFNVHCEHGDCGVTRH